MITWLGLDVGDKRIGLALGNDQAWLARPHCILDRRSNQQTITAISDVVSEHGIDELVVGIPYNMDGSEGDQARKVRSFVAKLMRQIDLPIHFIDERLTSFEADQILAYRSQRQRPIHNDHIAAAVILQTYLDQRRPLSAST